MIMDIADYKGYIPEEYYEPCVYDVATWYSTAATDACDKVIDWHLLSHREEEFEEVQYVTMTTVFTELYEFWYNNHNNLPRSKTARVLAFFMERSPILDASIEFIAEAKDIYFTFDWLVNDGNTADLPSNPYNLDELGPETSFVQNGTNKQATDLLKRLYDKVNEGRAINGGRATGYDSDFDAEVFYDVVNLISQMIDVHLLTHSRSEVDGLRGKYSGYVMTQEEAKELLDVFRNLKYTDIDWSVFD